MNTLHKTRRFIAQRFEIDESELHPESRLESLGLDSLATMELVFDIEDEFGIRMPQNHGRLATLGDLVGIVEHELARQRSMAA